MRKVVNAIVVVLIVMTTAAIGFTILAKMQDAARQISCRNNLKMIGFAIANYEASKSRYPRAAMPNAGLPPEKRLSWLVEVLPWLEANPTYGEMDTNKSWDAEENRFAALTRFIEFRCPGYAEGPPVSTLLASHYLGITGIGEDAVLLPMGHERAGLFGYERTVKLQDLTRGASQTAVVAETASAQGAWTAAGPATVNGIEPGTRPQRGPFGRFGGNHRAGCSVLFADVSVRCFGATISEAEWTKMGVLSDKSAEDVP